MNEKYEKLDDIEIIEDKPTKKKTKGKGWQTKKCKVLTYNKKTKTLGVLFDHYGVEIHNVENFEGGSDVIVRYKSKIGKADFEISL